MTKLKCLIVYILIITLFLTACYNNIGVKNDNNEVITDMDKTNPDSQNDDINTTDMDMMNADLQDDDINTVDMTKINLRDYNEEEKKNNIDVLLDQTENYPGVCTTADFLIKDEYAGFRQTSNSTTEYDSHTEINALYRLQTNSNEDDYDADVTISFYNSQSDNHMVMRNSLNDYTAPKIYPSSLGIGDFAIGGKYYINYIRGNVFVTVLECPQNHINEIEIDALAREIDNQILEILNKK